MIYTLLVEDEKMKMTKMVGVLTLLLVSGALIVPALAQRVDSVYVDFVSPGPAPSSGDGVPSGNQFIQPDTGGVGPAPNAGDGVSDGSGF